ncbi:MAG: hypothetical protein PHP64_07020, partial [Actinomycetota bacterium]|nr:hypothetical protein [Actinomycetota bacterium]
MKKSRFTKFFGLISAVLLLLLLLPAAGARNQGKGVEKKEFFAHGLGLELSGPVHERMISRQKLRSLASLPLSSSVDLSGDLPPIGDQGEHGSCVGWSTGYYSKTWWEKQEHPSWNLNDDKYYFSPAFVYNQINGGEDGGSSIYDAMNLLENFGCVDFEEFPYDGDYLKQPSSKQIEAAKQYKINKNWGQFFGQSDWGPYSRPNVTNNLKAWLNSGKPLVMGIPIYDDFPD